MWFTFKQFSVIDQAIASAQALKFVYDFEINALDALYRDGHLT